MGLESCLRSLWAVFRLETFIATFFDKERTFRGFYRKSESVNGTNAGRKRLPEDIGPDIPADDNDLPESRPGRRRTKKSSEIRWSSRKSQISDTIGSNAKLTHLPVSRLGYSLDFFLTNKDDDVRFFTSSGLTYQLHQKTYFEVVQTTSNISDDLPRLYLSTTPEEFPGSRLNDLQYLRRLRRLSGVIFVKMNSVFLFGHKRLVVISQGF
ncbi:hypothetical protein YC2023_065916 [Brassica napus]